MMSATGWIRRGEPVRPAGILPDARPGSSYLTDDPFGLATQLPGLSLPTCPSFRWPAAAETTGLYGLYLQLIADF